MNPVITRRAVLRAGLVLGSAMLLPAAHACEFFTTNLRVYRPWTRATADGDAFAVLCMTFDEVALDDRLIGVESPVATHADMAGSGGGPKIDVPIPAGADTVLSETGTFIRLLGLRHPLAVGRSYPLRLVFERGGVVDADIDVDYERAA
jgi:copper(I)-binding protein